MNIVNVCASKNYTIHIGSGLLSSVGEEVRKLGKVQSVCIVSESRVYPLYGDIVMFLIFKETPYCFP